MNPASSGWRWNGWERTPWPLRLGCWMGSAGTASPICQRPAIFSAMDPNRDTMGYSRRDLAMAS